MDKKKYLESRTRWVSSEMMVACRFAQAGYIIAWPTSPRPYDLIVDTGHRLHRIQVKNGRATERRKTETGWRDRAGYAIELDRNRSAKAKRGNRDWRIPAKEFDFLAVACPNGVYVIPINMLLSPEDSSVLVRYINIKPRDPANTRADADASARRWESLLDNFKLPE